MNTEPLPGWTGQAKQVLDESAQNLDAAAVSRLNRARQRALEQTRPRVMRPWFLPAGLASACAVLIAVAVAWHTPTHTAAPMMNDASAGTFASDLDMMSSDDGIEFYEDLDFYAWLDAQEKDNNG
jgi:hypothetical protein